MFCRVAAARRPYSLSSRARNWRGRSRICCARRTCASGCKRLLGPPEPASKRLNLREFAARVRYRVVGSPFELSFLHWQHARRLWPGNLSRAGAAAASGRARKSASRMRIRAATRRGASARTDFISGRSGRAARPMRLPPDFSTCLKFGAARSRFAAIRLFRAACIRK